MNPIPDEFWIVVTQYDTNATGFSFGGPPKGPLVHESYCLTRDDAITRARAMGATYGWSTILKVYSKDVQTLSRQKEADRHE